MRVVACAATRTCGCTWSRTSRVRAQLRLAAHHVPDGSSVLHAQGRGTRRQAPDSSDRGSPVLVKLEIDSRCKAIRCVHLPTLQAVACPRVRAASFAFAIRHGLF